MLTISTTRGVNEATPGIKDEVAEVTSSFNRPRTPADSYKAAVLFKTFVKTAA